MPIELDLSPESRRILRPEPPSWPCRGSTRTTCEWKCCSKSFLRMSMNMVYNDSSLTNQRSWLFSNISDSRSRDSVIGEPLNCATSNGYLKQLFRALKNLHAALTLILPTTTKITPNPESQKVRVAVCVEDTIPLGGALLLFDLWRPRRFSGGIIY